MSANFELLSQQKIADYIRDNAHDVNKMSEFAAYYQSLHSSKKDDGLASGENENVQTAQGAKITIEDLFREEKVTNSFPKVEPAMSDGKTKPTEKVIAVRKPKTFKPKEVLSLDRKYYTLEEVADCFRIGISTMHKKRKEGLIVGFKLGNQWRFSPEQVDAFESRINSVTK